MKKREELLQKYTDIRSDLEAYLNEFLLPLLRGRDLSKEGISILFYEDVISKTNLVSTNVNSIDNDGSVMLEFEYEGKTQIEDIAIEQCHLVTLIQLVEFLEPFTD